MDPVDSLPVVFEFNCVELPGLVFEERRHARLGIQAGKEVVDDVPVQAGDVLFRFTLEARVHPQTGRPTFRGLHAQGPADARFVYLCWGERIDGKWNGLRRAKIPLSGVSWERLRTAHEAKQPVSARIRMTDQRGGPVSATVKPENIAWL